MKRFVSIFLAAALMLLSLPASALAAGPSGDLDPDRTVPAAPALSYTDSVDIEYVDGAVLHYVDFSSVESLSEIGYYVGKNAATDNATLTIDQENGLRVQTTDQKVYITPFGAKVPKQIEDYTVQLEVKFNNPNGKYLVFNPAVNGEGTGAVNGDLAFRPQGKLDANWDQQKLWFHDKGQLMNGTTEEDANAVMEAVKAGEWATISFSVRNLGVVGVKVTAGGKTIYLQGNTARGVLGSNWGFMAGNGNDDMYVKSVAMIAGYDLTTELQWPADYVEGANVLDVPKTAYIDHSTIDLDPDRVIPETPELSYTDSADTEYVDGAVLHYVDFSSVKSLWDVGYYVGKNAATDNATLTIDQENGLHVQTTNQKVYITPFGAKVPRQIEDYTVQLEVKFNNPNGKYLVFNPAVNGEGTGAAKGDLAFRPQGKLDATWDQQKLWFHDKGQLMNGTTEEDANAVMEAVKAGEWATISFSVRNLGVVGVKVTAGGKTIYLQGNTARGVLGSSWGFMAGNGNDDMYVKSVAMIAGYDLTAELQWPADYVEGANVLDVPASALKSGTPGKDPTDPTDPAGPTEEGVLRVASYNIRLGGMWYGYDMEALAEEIRNSGADIIGLQEVDNNTDRNRYQETMKLLGEELGYYYYFNQVSELEGGGYGDGILSRYPITDVKEIPLQMVSQYATYGELTVAAIDVDGTEVLFGNTHFFEIDAEVSKVFQQIYDVMKDHDPFVVVGDFNNQYFEAFNSTFVDCTVANQGTYTTNENTCPDNIVLSPSIEMVDFVVTNTNASDHYLLTADIRLASGTGEEPAQHSVTLPDIFEGADDVEDGADYTFKARDTEHYVYSEVKANLPVIDNGDGTYTVKNVTEDLVISGKRTPKNDDGASGNLPGGTDSGNDSGNGGTGASDGKTDEDTQTPKTGETGGWQMSAVCALAALTLLTALTLSWKKLASNGAGGWKLRK